MSDEITKEEVDQVRELFEYQLTHDLGNTAHLASHLHQPPYVGIDFKFTRGQYILRRLTALGYVIEKRKL